MILGRGNAQTDVELIAEYHVFLHENYTIQASERYREIKNAPSVMRRRIGKPIVQWNDDDVLNLHHQSVGARRTRCDTFLTFLLFRGYFQPSLRFMENLALDLTRHWKRYLLPYRQKIIEAGKALGYDTEQTESRAGAVLHLLILLLVVTGTSFEEVTRETFDPFRDDYQKLYRAKSKNGCLNPHLSRLERYLEHWGMLQPTPPILRYEEYFAQLRHEPIKSAVLWYMKWASVKYQATTFSAKRTCILIFFLWLQQTFPHAERLDSVSREITLSYTHHLKQQMEAGCYGRAYVRELHGSIRLFFDFVVEEELATAPHRNPFHSRDVPHKQDGIPRYLSDHELQAVLTYCKQEASLLERVMVITLLHTGIRAAEFTHLKRSDIVQIGGVWKLHIHQGKGLKDRLIPLTPYCLATLQQWQEQGWEQITDRLFTRFGRPWQSTSSVERIIHQIGTKLSINNLTAHRFRHSFAVALLNYGMRESALQKLMGHATLNMTLEYARILDQTVEQAFSHAIEQMQEGAHSWVPNFFVQEDYTLFVEGDAVSWIRLPMGYCRRNPKLHCESDVKCLLCDRFAIGKEDLPRLRQMHDRFTKLGLKLKADVVATQIERLELSAGSASPGFIPVSTISRRDP